MFVYLTNQKPLSRPSSSPWSNQPSKITSTRSPRRHHTYIQHIHNSSHFWYTHQLDAIFEGFPWRNPVALHTFMIFQLRLIHGSQTLNMFLHIYSHKLYIHAYYGLYHRLFSDKALPLLLLWCPTVRLLGYVSLNMYVDHAWVATRCQGSNSTSM